MKTFQQIVKNSQTPDSAKPYDLNDLTQEQIDAIHGWLQRSARYDCRAMPEHAEEMAQFWITWLWLGKSERMLKAVGKGNHQRLAYYLRKRARRWRILDGGDRHGMWTTPKESKRNSIRKRSDKDFAEYRKRNDLTAWQAAKNELCRTYQYNRSNDRPDMTENRLAALEGLKNNKRLNRGSIASNLTSTLDAMGVKLPPGYDEESWRGVFVAPWNLEELEKIDRTEDMPRTCEVSHITRPETPVVYGVATGKDLPPAELQRLDEYGRRLRTPEEQAENSRRYIDKCRKERTAKDTTRKLQGRSEALPCGPVETPDQRNRRCKR